MKRTSHLTLRRRLEDEKSKITDKELFTSSLFRGYLADMAEATGKRYKKPIKIILGWDESEDAAIAFTDNNVIYINAANPITSGLLTRTLKALSLIGILAHEIGHILFSDFTGLAAFKEVFANGGFHPETPASSNKVEDAALNDLILDVFRDDLRAEHKSTLALMATVAFKVLNSIEDVYVEARVCHKFPGNYKAGIGLISTHFIQNMPSLKTQMDNGCKPLAIMDNLVLDYARSGDIKNPEGLENEYTEALYRCIPYIDDAIYDEDANVRYGSANKILLNLWPFIKDAVKKIDEAESLSAGSGDAALAELLNQLMESAAQSGATTTPKGANKPSAADDEPAPGKKELAASSPTRKTPSKKPEPVINEDEGSEPKNETESHSKPGSSGESTETKSPNSGESISEETDGERGTSESSEADPSKYDDESDGDSDGEGKQSENNGENEDGGQENTSHETGQTSSEEADDLTQSGEASESESESSTTAAPKCDDEAGQVEDNGAGEDETQDISDHESGQDPSEETEYPSQSNEASENDGGFDKNGEDQLSSESGSVDGSTETGESGSSTENLPVDDLGDTMLTESTDKESAKTTETAPESAQEFDSSDIDAVDFESSVGTDEPQDVIEDESWRIPLVETDDFDTGDEGGLEQDRDYSGSGYAAAASDVERLLNKMAQGRVDEALETELHENLQAFADGIRYGDAHKGIKVRINRMTSVDDYYIERYHNIAGPLIILSKCLQKQVSQILKDRREGGKLTGLLYGKRFSAKDTFRGDGRQFYNTRLPCDPMELAVAILVDESGSMDCNDRATVARAASIVLYDFCRGLNIPVAIYGHTTHSYNKDEVELYAHAEFDSVDNRDKYRLMDISARDCNRDGAALRFVSERLLKRHEPLKLLFLISDGQPHDGFSYYGTAAEEDLRGIKQEYTRKGIKLFAAAIGDDKPNIERIYGDGFLDITDLNKLPLNLCSLLSRYIKAM